MAPTRKTSAFATISAIPNAARVVPSEAAWITPATMARSTSPSTSSITAAPRMMRALAVFVAFASCSTRAVMPTEVAASIAPRNAWAIQGSSGSITSPTTKPRAMGATTPTIATRVAGTPTAIMSLGVDSRPTSRRSRIAPSSARIAKVSLDSRGAMLGPPTRARLPRTMPKSSSPSTEGWPARSTSAPRSLDPTRTTARPIRMRPCSGWAEAASRRPESIGGPV